VVPWKTIVLSDHKIWNYTGAISPALAAQVATSRVAPGKNHMVEIPEIRWLNDDVWGDI
jgi:hypothetical protein